MILKTFSLNGKMNLLVSLSHSFNSSFHAYTLLQRIQRSMTVCKICFLPVVLELSPGVFNNSVLAVPGDLPGRQCEAAREDTYSFSQSEWGRRRRLAAYSCNKMVTFYAAFCLQLCPASVAFITSYRLSQCLPRFGI